MPHLIAATSTVDIAGELNALAGSGPVIQPNLGTIISSYIGVAILVGSIAALGFMLLGGVSWITAGGDTGKIEKARTKIMQSVIGLAVLVTTYALFTVIQYFFGISILGSGGAASFPPASSVNTGGGSTTGGGSGGGVNCVVGQTYNDGGAGGYCNGGSARVKCVAAGVGPSRLNYVHYEPCDCISGSRDPRYSFMRC